MPPPKRTALLGHVASIQDDLRMLRDKGGLAYADAQDLAGLVHVVKSRRSCSDEEAFAAAAETLSAHVNRWLHVFGEAHTDPCDLAAATSLYTLLLQPPDANRLKASAVRKQNIDRFSCGLSADGLRKREDRLLADLAKAIWRDVSSDGPGPPEQVMVAMVPVAMRLRRVLRDQLCDLFDRALENQAVDDDLVLDSLAESLLLGVTIQASARELTEAIDAAGPKTTSDYYFRAAAEGLWLLQFSEADRDFLHGFRRDRVQMEADAFLYVVAEDETGKEVLQRLSEWLFSCASDMRCSYGRTTQWKYMCGPHRLASLLEDFLNAVKDYAQGTLDGNQSSAHLRMQFEMMK